MSKKTLTELPNRNIKSLAFMLLVAGVFLCLSIRLFYLQSVQYEANIQSADENRLRRIVLTAERGLIYDRNGTLLVGNRPSYQIVILPGEIRKMKAEKKEALFKKLIHVKDSQGEALFDSAVVDTMFQRSGWKSHGTLRILEDASEEQVSIMQERSGEFPGVTTVVESRRSYPYGTLAAHLLGYTGEISDEQLLLPEYAGYSSGDRVGQKGLEKQYDGEFRGEDGVKYVEVDAYGRQVRNIEGMQNVPSVPGYGMITTIDLDIQKVAEEALPDSISFNERNKRSGWRWARGLILNLAIGQGQLVTPLQEAVLAGSIATGKGVYRPHLMKELRDVNGNLVGRYIPEKIFEGNMSESTHRALLAGMDSVVNHPGGTGKRAAIPGIRVGGKSGSGEWKKGEKTHAWFVAVAPLENPEIAVAVIQEAQGGGGSKSAPVCRRVMEAYFEKMHKKDSTEVKK